MIHSKIYRKSIVARFSLKYRFILILLKTDFQIINSCLLGVDQCIVFMFQRYICNQDFASIVLQQITYIYKYCMQIIRIDTFVHTNAIVYLNIYSFVDAPLYTDSGRNGPPTLFTN